MKRTRVLVAAAVAAGVGLAAGGYGVASAATAPPALSFVAATKDVTATRYIDDSDPSNPDTPVYLDFDLGVNLIAGASPLEFRVSRKSYADPIVARQITVVNGVKKSTVLPAGMVTGFGGLDKFTTIIIKDAAGKVVKSYQTQYCPNTYNSARARRDAPASTPYPQDCNGGYNPFTLGSVWGVQAGWNSTTSSYPGTAGDQDPTDFDLNPGKYTVTVDLNPVYRTFFKIPAASSTAKLNLTVVNADINGNGQGLARAKAKLKSAELTKALVKADEHSAHAGQGDPNHQISSYLPGFTPPAKAPKSLAAVPATGPRPDLRSLPAWGISVSQGEKEDGTPDGKWYVNFGATVWNAGTSPLLVDGFRRTGTELMDAYQYFFDAKGNQVGSVPAGTMQWDNREGHKHWHFTDFAQYNLLSADQKLKVRSGKEAFCLANTDAVDYTLLGAKWRPGNTDLATACGGNTAVAVREVLDQGNGDTYSQARPGQSFEITDLPNGTYYIQVLANPAHKLTELSTTNNASLRKIVLGGTPAERTITVPPVNGIIG